MNEILYAQIESVVRFYLARNFSGSFKFIVDTKLNTLENFLAEIVESSSFEKKQLFLIDDYESKLKEFLTDIFSGYIVFYFAKGVIVDIAFVKDYKKDAKDGLLKKCMEYLKCKFVQNAKKKSDTSQKVIVKLSSAILHKQSSTQKTEER